MSEFFTEFLALLTPGRSVLDLGAGSGRQALAMAERGCRVWAVDRQAGNVAHDRIVWQAARIEEWLQKPAEVAFDAVLMGNVIQFFPREWVAATLVPELVKRTAERAVVGVRTFFQPPEPKFDRELTYWSASELVALFPNWECVYQNQESKASPDMKGMNRLFHTSSIIIRKL